MTLEDAIKKGQAKKRWEARMGEAIRRDGQREEAEELVKKLTDEAVDSSNRKCGTCMFWEEDKNQSPQQVHVRVGVCHRYPPTPFLIFIPPQIQGGPPSTMIQSHHAASKVFGWCGKWKEVVL